MKTFTKDEISKLVRKAFSDVLSLEAFDELDLMPDSNKASFVLENTNLSALEIAQRLANIADMDILKNFDIPTNASEILSMRLIATFHCVPSTNGKVVTSWIPDEEQLKWITVETKKFPQYAIVPVNKLSLVLSETFGVGADTLDDDSADEFTNVDESQILEDENAAIIKFVNEVITRAIADRATDIHIEPAKDTLNIRYRIDGNLTSLKLSENLIKFRDAIISRIKIMAHLNISEKRRPQDGRISFITARGEDIDIRVSSLPTLYGESISLRLLNTKAQSLTISDLGFLPDDAKKIETPLASPHGIILVTGPTGSGKSTSLTAFIRKIKSPEIRIITVEDPVEYEIEGVNQTQVHPEIGLTFSSVLRSVLRQDPDIIMVGEIRDRETADIAIRASLTGHLVLSTLHTNDAAGALTRLLDMDIEPFLIASSVEAILAQRLVRRLCSCASAAKIDSNNLKACLDVLGVDEAQVEYRNLVLNPQGCDRCRKTGYSGRIGMFEILMVNETINSMIIARRTAQEIKDEARRNGMRTMQECGWELVKRGLTSLDEVMVYANLQEGK